MHTQDFLAQIQPLLPMLDGLSTQWKTWKEQFGSYLIATGLDKAPKEKQLAIFLQRLGTDRPCILPTHTGNNLKPVPLPLTNSLPVYCCKESLSDKLEWKEPVDLVTCTRLQFKLSNPCLVALSVVWQPGMEYIAASKANKHHCGAVFITIMTAGFRVFKQSINWKVWQFSCQHDCEFAVAGELCMY